MTDENMTENEDGSINLTLQYPFTWGKEEDGERIKELRIKRIKTADMRGLNAKKLEEGDMEEIFKLISKLIGEPKPFVDLIDMADIQVMGEIIRNFLDSGRKTGGIA